MRQVAFLFLVAAFGSIFAYPARSTAPAPAADRVLLEAENFDDCGGWVVDQQFMDQMGSPYLLAHGLGDPVRDAVDRGEVSVGRHVSRLGPHPRLGRALEGAGAPGRFQVLVDGKPLATTFGTEGAAWHWQDGGLVEVAGDKRKWHCTTSPASKAAAMPCSSARIRATSRRTIWKRWENSAASCSACRSSPNAAGSTTWLSWEAAWPAPRPPWPERGSA